MKIDITLCTFQRAGVVETLRSIAQLDIPEGVDLGVIVVDNDHEPTALTRVRRAMADLAVRTRYLHAPAANISLARNAALEASVADWIAFLDDDEVLSATWLKALLARQVTSGADAVFGHSRALYQSDAPPWIVVGDYHSNNVETRNGVVETGYTCNALLRWSGTPWQGERFKLDLGRSGGEDTEFFFRLSRMGARFAIADDALVYETIEPRRLSFNWLRQRKFRMGQSYACCARDLPAKIGLFATAGMKAAYCHMRALSVIINQERRNFWLLRGALHLGVCGGCLALPMRRLYGE
mgnify:CR=1 FL=1